MSTSVNFSSLMRSLREAVKTLRAEKYEEVLQSYAGVKVINGRAEFTGPDTVKIECGGDV